MSDWEADDVTVACDVYEEDKTPGLYMITGFQLELCAAFYGMDAEALLPYEGEDGNWYNAQIVIDATNPEAVTIAQQPYGIYTNSTYQYAIIFSVAPGKAGEAIVGANVLLQGSRTVYTMSDVNGAFTINVPANGVLDVNCMGYQDAQIQVNNRTSIAIVLADDNQLLEETIVVAYGTATKSS